MTRRGWSLLPLLLYAAGCAAIRGAVAPSVDPPVAARDVPLPPDAESLQVRAAGPMLAVRTAYGTAVAYELLVTNGGTVPAVIARAEALEARRDSVLALFDAHDPDRWLGAHAERADAPGTSVQAISPGASAMVFWWLDVPVAAGVPERIAHRVTQPRGTVSTGAAAQVDTGSVAEVSTPFLSGTWWIAGGAANDAPRRRAFTFPADSSPVLPGRFATEWVKVDDEMAVARLDGAENVEWYGYTDPVLAVAAGRVVYVRDTIEDNVPGTAGGPAGSLGNVLVIETGGAADPPHYVVYGHLMPRTLRVAAGDVVRAGDYVAQVGNSGDSPGPRLYLAVVRGTLEDGWPTGQGVPFVLDDFRLVGKHPDDSERPGAASGRYRGVMPMRGDVILVRP